MYLRILILSLFVSLNAFAIDNDSSKPRGFTFGVAKERTPASHSKKAEPVETPVVKSSYGYDLRDDNPRYASISADFLYWKYSVTDDFAGYTYTTNPHHFLERLKTDSMPGFRFNVTVSNIYDWNIGATGTYVHSGDKKTIVPGQVLIPFITIASGTASGVSSLTYATADLDFSSKLFLRRSISIQPLFAVEAVYVKRHTTYLYHFTHLSIPSNYEFDTPVKFIGYGPKVGTYLNCKFGNSGVEFFGGLFSAMVYGRTKSLFQIMNVDTGLFSQMIDKQNDIKVGMQLQLGAHYQYFFSDSCAFGIKACYETNYWWNLGNHSQLSFLDISTTKITDNIAFHGFNVGIDFEF